MEKKARGTPCFFFRFLTKNLFSNFTVITIVIYRGILKMNENVRCLIISLNAPKMWMKNVIFAGWAELALL